MNKNAHLKVRRLTKNQAKALKAIAFPISKLAGSAIPGTYVSLASGLRGNELGGTVSALERSNIIQPFGREGRQFNWELTDPDLIQAKKEDPKTLIKILGKLAGEDKK